VILSLIGMLQIWEVYFEIPLAADCSAVTSRIYVTYIRQVCVTTQAQSIRMCSSCYVQFIRRWIQ